MVAILVELIAKVKIVTEAAVMIKELKIRVLIEAIEGFKEEAKTDVIVEATLKEKRRKLRRNSAM